MRKFEITVRGDAAVLDFDKLGPRDSAKFRKATGMGLSEALQNAQEIDVICALWWLARVQGGQQLLTFDQALDAFPTLGEFSEETLKLEEITDEEEVEDDTPLELDAA